MFSHPINPTTPAIRVLASAPKGFSLVIANSSVPPNATQSKSVNKFVIPSVIKGQIVSSHTFPGSLNKSVKNVLIAGPYSVQRLLKVSNISLMFGHATSLSQFQVSPIASVIRV